MFFDIETDDYLSDWQYTGETPTCLCIATALDSEEPGAGYGEEVLDYLAELNKQDILVGHGIIRYDLPFLERFYGWKPRPEVRIYDTLILSQLMYPERKHHGLEYWGEDFGIPKPQVGSFKSASPELVKCRAKQDVSITRRLFHHLASREHASKYKEAYALEAKVCEIIAKQELRGVNFDSKKAEENLIKLDALSKEIEDIVEPGLPQRMLPPSQVKHPPKQRFKKDGTPTKHAIEYFGEDLQLKDGKWVVDRGSRFVPLAKADNAYKTTAPMKLINRSDIKKYLISLGWKPTLWNTDDQGNPTSPKIHENGVICSDLIRLGSTIPDVKLILKWNTYQSRRNIIRSRGEKTGLLTHPRLAYDGRIPASANTLGAVTRRMAHKGVANIPRTTSLFGEEMREMFVPTEGLVQVGWDAASLEECMKAHYVHPFDPEYASQLIRPGYSPHDDNAELWKVPRDLAKNGLYALTYGCSPRKLATVLKKPESMGQVLYDLWWEKNKPLLLLKESLTKQWEATGQEYILSLDGAPLHVRKPHALLNMLFQPAGIIVMKRAMLIWHQEIQDKGIDAHQTIHYHDEAQAECLEEVSEAVGNLGVQSIVKAGQWYNLNVPLSGTYKIGKSWADTH